MKTIAGLTLLCSVLGSGLGSAAMHGQASSTASKLFDVQAGGDFVLDRSDYGSQFKGGGVYATLDFTNHFGAEVDFHQANASGIGLYERTYEAGGRYHRDYGRFEPYAKFLYLRGKFNFVDGYTGAVLANLAYNGFALGGGTDFHVKPWLNLRADYEYQDWFHFEPRGLTPMLVSFGVAYHVPGGLQKGRRFR